MTKQVFNSFFTTVFIFASLYLTSCVSGYRYENGKWSYVDYLGTRGRHEKKVNVEANETLNVLKNKDYAITENAVFYLGEQIKDADPKSFKTINKNGYAKDKKAVYLGKSKINYADPHTFRLIKHAGYYVYAKDHKHVFLDDKMILFAEPSTFQILKFPYAKDKNDVYCGTLPLNLSATEIEEFKVTNTDKLSSNMKSSILLSHFIERNPSYAWLDTLDVNGVVIGEWGTGETKSRKFKGFKEVK